MDKFVWTLIGGGNRDHWNGRVFVYHSCWWNIFKTHTRLVLNSGLQSGGKQILMFFKSFEVFQ